MASTRHDIRRRLPAVEAAWTIPRSDMTESHLNHRMMGSSAAMRMEELR
jgi:hypothetical protein